MPDPPDRSSQDRSAEDLDHFFDVDRTVAFSDAVIAVAITLLVVTLEVPNVSSKELGSALADLEPTMIGFFVSFWLIAGFWIQHHQFGRRLHAIDRRLMQINLVFLFAISLTSFGTALFGSYSDNVLALTIYTVILVVLGLTMTWLWRYGLAHDLVIGPPPRGVDDTLEVIVRTVIFLSAIPLGLFTPWAPLVWLLNTRLDAITNLLRGRRSRHGRHGRARSSQ